MQELDSDNLAREGPLSPKDAVAALLVLDDRRYLLQLRDQRPGIFYPGHWGLFGGAIEKGETPEDGLRRELIEELGIEFCELTYITKLTFDFSSHGFGTVTRHYFEIIMSHREFESVILGEGADAKPFDGVDIIKMMRVVPYDSFAIWLHLTRKFKLEF